MSNSKWLKLIHTIVQNSDLIKKIEFKKIQANQIGELYLNEDTTFGFDYWENGFEGHNSLGGWLEFREIEYLVFPKFINSTSTLEQSLQQIAEVINNVGEFCLEANENSLKLICHQQ